MSPQAGQVDADELASSLSKIGHVVQLNLGRVSRYFGEGLLPRTHHWPVWPALPKLIRAANRPTDVRKYCAIATPAVVPNAIMSSATARLSAWLAWIRSGWSSCEIQNRYLYRSAAVGNFGITDVSPQETWVIATECMKPGRPDEYGSDNSIFVVTLHWDRPNRWLEQ